MEYTSPFLAMQHVEQQVKAMLRAADAELPDAGQQKAVSVLKRLVIDARLDIRDYELSETRSEQLAKMVQAKKRLSQLQANILAAGPVFGPADVAQITAQLEQVALRLQ